MAQKLPRFLSQAEAEAMFKLAAGNTRDSLIMKLMFYLGLRNSEVQNLRIEDIDYFNMNIKVVQGKGKKDRYVPIPTTMLLREIKKYIGGNKTGKVFYVTDRHIRRIVKDYATKAGLRNPSEIHPHTLRHSYATHLQNKGIPLNMIQSLLGHSKIDTTTVYIHMALEHKSKLVSEAFGEKKTNTQQTFLDDQKE